MPTFKHPCPACGRLIARDVARCPFCGAVDPFVPGRCPKCRAPIEDPAWVACAKCGTPLRAGVAPMPGAVPAVATPGTVPAAPASKPTAEPTPHVEPAPPAPPASLVPAPSVPTPTASASCPGCGVALVAGASFCTTCGTLAG